MGTRVYIGRLSSHVRERDVERFFKGYGRIRELMLKNGYGFVEFDDYRDADDAVYELNGKELCGERVVVEYARGPSRRGGGYGSSRRSSSWIDKVLIEHARGLPRGTDYRRERMPPRRSRGSRDKYGPPVRTEYRLIVENLSSRVSWQDLKDYMRQAGEVTYADAHKQRKNEGIVEFATYSDMKSALDKLDDTEINGRRIRLIEDRPRRSRRSSSSSSRSRSRSPRRRSRSRSRSHTKSSSRSRNRSRSSSHDRHDRKRRSLSRDKSRSRSRSHSRSRSLSHSRTHSRSPSRSHSRSPSRSHSRSHSKSRSHSRSKSHSRSRSPEVNNKENHDDKSDHEDD